VEKATVAIQQMNMIPELVKMTCSMFGAWGEAGDKRTRAVPATLFLSHFINLLR
jgi:hypothetical protein